MPEIPYIPRQLVIDDQRIEEEEALSLPGVLLVLAEPGAGKTEYLKHVAESTAGLYIRASHFMHRRNVESNATLILDALDEVARIDQSATDAILVKASEYGAEKIVLASRSSEWDVARTRFARDCFAQEIKTCRLQPFNVDEQNFLFNAMFPEETFAEFLEQTRLFDLDPLLGNPQFMQLFGEAYIEGGRRFSSKRQIFQDASLRLAAERPDSPNQRGRPGTREVLSAGENIFAKLLLAGASGVATVEHLHEEDYPYLMEVPELGYDHALNTRLFKPASEASKHDPVHRIVAEYGAAKHLNELVREPSNSLSLSRVLAIVAPNSVVRDELRGLLGWMASFGDQQTQSACIDLDPYAVLANGDPSQLSRGSKLRLLEGLRRLSEIDPYFRRSDSWRRFSVAGFFDNFVLDAVLSILADRDDRSHLRALIIELTSGSSILDRLTPTLRGIIFDPTDENLVRTLALRGLPPSAFSEDDVSALIRHNDRDSLSLAAEIVERAGSGYYGTSCIAELLFGAAGLLQSEVGRRRRDIGSTYFINRLVDTLSPPEAAQALDVLTQDVRCVCDTPRPYNCDCRTGLSKICGLLLDRCLTESPSPYDPERVWSWIRNLRFRGSRTARDSTSVRVLQDDHTLRRAIHRLALSGLSDADEIWEALAAFRFNDSHSGLVLTEGDARELLDSAFAELNVPLWEALFFPHSPYRAVKGPDPDRAHMRNQARQSPALLEVWTRRERRARRHREEMRDRSPRRIKRYAGEEKRIIASNLEHLRANRERIVQGTDWWWLKLFARHYLHFPEKLDELTGGDSEVAEISLSNCLSFMSPHVPSLTQLADSTGGNIVEVLHAAALAIFRRSGSLSQIPSDVLTAIKTDVGDHKERAEGEREEFEGEIDSLIFKSDEDVEDFASRYLEPQLARSPDSTTTISMLSYKQAFASMRGRLALQWLDSYPAMPRFARDTLFDVAAQAGDRDLLNELIERRCRENSLEADSELNEDQRFWFFRQFFFSDQDSAGIWTRLLSDHQTIFSLQHLTGNLERGKDTGWPALDATKLGLVLDANVERWPPVELPSSYGTGDPPEQTAYRYLREVVWQIGRDDPTRSISVLDRLIGDPRFASYRTDALSVRASSLRRAALREFQPPTWNAVSTLLAGGFPASVEDLRALILDELRSMNNWLRTSETNPIETFYVGRDGRRVDENTARNRIVDRLASRFQAANLSIVVERHMADSNRCDIAASAMLGGRQSLLVVEVKGQWHSELFSAAAEQLSTRYASHPDASEQGVYLVLWFGVDELIAGRRRTDITSPNELREEIIRLMPAELIGRIDVVVLDLSR